MPIDVLRQLAGPLAYRAAKEKADHKRSRRRLIAARRHSRLAHGVTPKPL
jgi:hypothetical protein